MIILLIILIGFLAFIVFWQSSLLFATVFGAPTVYASNIAIIDSFKLAGLKQGQLVVDLGCGNAKSLIIAAKKFGAKGVGVERSPYAYLVARINVIKNRAQGKVKIVFGDFKKIEPYLCKADVVYLYLLNSDLRKMESWFFEIISPQTKVAVLSFRFDQHKPIESRPTVSLGKPTFTHLYLKK